MSGKARQSLPHVLLSATTLDMLGRTWMQHQTNSHTLLLLLCRTHCRLSIPSTSHTIMHLVQAYLYTGIRGRILTLPGLLSRPNPPSSRRRFVLTTDTAAQSSANGHRRLRVCRVGAVGAYASMPRECRRMPTRLPQDDLAFTVLRAHHWDECSPT